jgi:hypothetical protein
VLQDIGEEFVEFLEKEQFPALPDSTPFQGNCHHRKALAFEQHHCKALKSQRLTCGPAHDAAIFYQVFKSEHKATATWLGQYYTAGLPCIVYVGIESTLARAVRDSRCEHPWLVAGLW